MTPLSAFRKNWMIGGAMTFMVSFLALSQSESQREFEDRRSQLIAEFDANKDGRLDALERETMRLARQAKAGERRGRSRERHPKELLAKYDKDKSGWIDGDEWAVAGPTESGIIKKQYDADGNGELDGDEKEALMGAIKSGKLKGLYGGIAHHWLIRLPGRERGRKEGESGPSGLLRYDTDGDGLASPEELAAIRAARKRQE